MATRLQISQEERLKIVKDRINQYGIRFPIAELHEKLKIDMGNISNILKGKKPVSDNFYTKFIQAYPDKVSLKPKQKEDENYKLPIGELKITLQDYINLLHRENERLFSLLNSTLGQIHFDTRYALAYQKAWVKYEAERASGGDKQKEAEVMYKMSKLVDDEIPSDDESDNPD